MAKTKILDFNSRGAWGSSTYTWTHDEFASWISIPVVRGGVQPGITLSIAIPKNFNSRGAWGSST